MIKYSPLLTKEQIDLANAISSECGILFDTARLLVTRNIDSVEKAKEFLRPSKEHFHSPFIMSCILEGVERIVLAKNRGENILIFGDYDADGICATTILYKALKDFGVTARYMIPERAEGYGLNVEKITAENDRQKIDLLITVDCGVSDREKIERLKEMGIEVIVTDHHEVPDLLPSCLVINPKKHNESYPFSALCGAGVSYKLASALIGEKADDYLDLVALATVADSMEITGENRSLVFEGLKIFNSTNIRLPFICLLGDNKKAINAQTLAYSVAPKINAGGRMGDANLALSLLLEDSPEKVAYIASKLSEYNTLRQEGCDKIFKEATQIIQEHKLYKDRVILVENKEWQAGFLGIVAVWIVEKYNRPAIIFSNLDGHLKGSARSVDSVNIYDAISSAQDILIAFGGHSQAAGVAVSEENFESLRKRLCDYISEHYGEAEASKDVYAEWDIDSPVSVRFAKEINLLEPFGVGNPKPFFTTSVNSLLFKPLKVGSPHYSAVTDNMEILHFNGQNDLLTLLYPMDKKIVVELNYSEFRGKQTAKGFLKQIVCDYSSFKNLKYYVFSNELKKITYLNGEVPKVTNENLERGYSTLYVLSDIDNMPSDLGGLSVYYFDLPVKNATNCVVVSPSVIPAEYERVVYLDRPFAYFNCENSLVFDKNNTFINNISTDREIFKQVFNLIDKKQNVRFIDIVSLYFTLKNEGKIENISAEQFIFSAEVFFELNFFYQANGVLIRNKEATSPLTNSKIYCKIQEIKG